MKKIALTLGVLVLSGCASRGPLDFGQPTAQPYYVAPAPVYYQPAPQANPLQPMIDNINAQQRNRITCTSQYIGLGQTQTQCR